MEDWAMQFAQMPGQHLLINPTSFSTPPFQGSLKTRARGEDARGGFFQECLAKSRGSTPGEQQLWREGIYEQIQEMMPLQGVLSIERMCQLAQVGITASIVSEPQIVVRCADATTHSSPFQGYENSQCAAMT